MGIHDINNKRKNDAFLRCSKEEGHYRYCFWKEKKILPTPAQFKQIDHIDSLTVNVSAAMGGEGGGEGEEKKWTTRNKKQTFKTTSGL